LDWVVNVSKITLPVLLTIAAGYFCKKRKILKQEAVDGIKALVMNIMLPALAFSIFVSADYNAGVLMSIGTMFIFCILALLLGMLIQRVLHLKQRFFPALTTTYEGLLGFAFYTLLFGAENLARYAVLDLAQGVFVFTLYLTFVNKRQGTAGSGVKGILKGMFTNPTLIANLSGLTLGATGLAKMFFGTGTGEVVMDCLKYISGPTIVLMLITVGVGLEFSKKNFRIAAGVSLARLAVCALLGTALLGLFSLMIGVDKLLFWAVILEFTLPPVYCLTVFIKTDQEVVSSALSLYTVISIACYIGIALLVA